MAPRRPQPLSAHQAARARRLRLEQLEQIEARIAAERGRKARARYLDLAVAALFLAIAGGFAWWDAVLAFD